ncbi:MAG: hypothetical protein HY738_13765, partial [Bacteroidia bacterium]|nr:hypothetical protein [Bacteroidia bacterium]
MKSILKILLFLLLFSFTGLAFAQNLVPNPSFEDYDTSIVAGCSFERLIEWKSFGYTPNYHNVYLGGVPNNGFGYQIPASGVAYISSGCYSTYPTFPNVREYIGVKFIDTLNIGTKYYFQMKVSATYSNPGNSNCAINKMGALFSTISYEVEPCISTTLLSPPNFAHIYSTEIISDSANWTTLSGSFVADSAYLYLVIGNFFDNSSTQYIIVGDTSISPFLLSYYYIDDIYVGINPPDNILDKNLKENHISVYPNPINDYLVINISESLVLSTVINIYDIYGNFILNYKLTSLNQSINIKELEPCIYI